MVGLAVALAPMASSEVVPVPVPVAEAPSLHSTASTRGDAAVLWRGFEHRWSDTNHRVNRLGSFISGMACGSSPCTATVVHGAASGIGSDTINYKTYFTELAVDDVGLKPGYSEFALSGDENNVIHTVRKVSMAADANTRARDNYTVVLNGFDLCATEEAKKPISFFVWLHSERYDPASDTIEFLMELWLNCDCDTGTFLGIECESGEESAAYDVRVSYLVIAGEDGYHASSKDFSRSYGWDHETEIYSDPISGSITGSTRHTYPKAVLGLKKVLFDLENTEDRATILRDEGHWHHSWYTSVVPVNYESSTGTMDLEVDLLFKQWADPVPTFSYKNKGNAFLQAQVVLLQFKDVDLTHRNHSGSYAWDKKNEPCSSDGREDFDVSFEF